MEPVGEIEAVAAPLRLDNVDTDQILPARFLSAPRSDGYGQFLFHDLRRTSQSSENTDFILDHALFRDAGILVAGRDFGGGSSREGAVYALVDAGFRAVIAAGFGDIFAGNAVKNGLLPIDLPVDIVSACQDALLAAPGSRIRIDLASQTVMLPDGIQHGFAIDGFAKDCLLKGMDEIDLTLSDTASIDRFETDHADRFPWTTPKPASG